MKEDVSAWRDNHVHRFEDLVTKRTHFLKVICKFNTVSVRVLAGYF